MMASALDLDAVLVSDDGDAVVGFANPSATLAFNRDIDRN